VASDEKLTRSARNIAGVTVATSGSVTARQVMDASRVVATRDALAQLQDRLS